VGLAAVAEALRRADVVFLLNPNDAECVLPLVRAPTETLLPFLDTAPYRRARARRAAHRRTLAQRFAIPMRPPWLLAVGMMRPGDKLASFRVLARALRGLAKWPWHLIVIGDGPARGEVRRVLSGLGRRVHWIGALPESALPSFYAASDVLVWPAVNEAIGMAILEAQAAGLPVVAGNAGAIGVIVGDGQTGSLAPVGRAGPFRRALAGLLRQSELRAAMSRRALEKTGQWHGLDRAAEQLDRALQAAVAKVRTGARP
jgi:glycosyltransferase involved in cell wall biosynthesis